MFTRVYTNRPAPQILNLLFGCVAVRYFLARQASTVSSSLPAPLVVQLGSRSAGAGGGAGVSGGGWGGRAVGWALCTTLFCSPGTR
jgi:hypothetical protein